MEREKNEFNLLFQGRVPAQATLDFMKETGKSLTDFALAMNDVKNKFSNIESKVKETNELLRSHIKDQTKFQYDFECNAKTEHEKIYSYINGNFASKEVEKILKKINWIIIYMFVVSLVAVIIIFGSKLKEFF